MRLLLGLIKERFGTVTPGVRRRLAALPQEELEAVGLRILRAQRVERFVCPLAGAAPKSLPVRPRQVGLIGPATGEPLRKPSTPGYEHGV
jgi:hypothetical protein